MDEIHDFYQTLDEGFKKFSPNDLPSPHWYDTASLKQLIFGHVREARQGGEDLLLRDFVRKNFRGLSGNAKTKEICDQLPGIKRLSDFREAGGDVAYLLGLMRHVTQQPKPDVLSLVGKENFYRRLEERYKLGRRWYKKGAVTVRGVPYVFEVALAETNSIGGLFTGVNFSPTFDDPLSSSALDSPEFEAFGIEGFLEDAHIEDNNTVAAAHLITPASEFLDRGKTRLRVPDEVKEMVAGCLWSVTKTLYQEEERRRKDAARQAKADRNREREQARAEKRKNMSDRDAVFAVLEEAWAEGTGNGSQPISVRSLFYQVRPLIQKYGYTDKELGYSYYANTLVPEYQRTVRQLPGVYYEPRGVLYEPHTGREVPLGTREVESYEFPEWRYDKILYVEKAGLWPVLQRSRIAERFDMAIVAASGFSTEAARVLFANAEKDRDYELYVLHDADPSGYEIARTLRESTKRMPEHHVNVVDLGLHVEEALAMDLLDEEFTRTKALSESLVPQLSEKELEYFVGEDTGKKTKAGNPIYLCKRIELNAFSSPQLIAYIERKLEEAGAGGKVVPDAAVLPEQAERLYREKVSRWVDTEVEQMLDLDTLKKAIADDLIDEFKLGNAECYIRARFRQDETYSWDGALKDVLTGIYQAKKDTLMDSVKTKAIEALNGKENSR